MRSVLRTIGLGLMLALSVRAAHADAEYTMHGRVSYDAGSNLIKGQEDKDWTHATVNTLILPGDTLWVDEGGTSEIEFSGGTYLRGADGTKVEISGLPPQAMFKLWEGSMYIQRLSRSTGEVRIETPSARISIENDSIVRIDVLDKGGTTLSVRTGRATISALDGGGTVGVDSGERAWADPGLLPSEPSPFDLSVEDPLDQWNRERGESLAAAGRTIPREVTVRDDTIGVSDLNDYGEWVTIDSQPCWRPTTVVNYVPYRYGYWSDVPRVGNCWVDNYPFSYVTCHYGRWGWYRDYGWCWRYDPVWSPAWVASVRCDDYYVWAPCGWDYRPVTVAGASFSVGGVDFFIGASSYVPMSYYHEPRYIAGCYPEFGTYVGHANVVNVWNINVYNDRRVPVPWTRDLPVWRDDRRDNFIRGRYELTGGVRAGDRVRNLESRLGRTSFDAVDRGSVRNERTNIVPERRNAIARPVSVREGYRQEAERMNPRLVHELDPKVGRADDPRTGRPAVEERPLRESVRERQDVPASVRSRNPIESSPRSRDDATPGRSRGDVRNNDGDSSANSTVRGRSDAAPGRSRDSVRSSGPGDTGSARGRDRTPTLTNDDARSAGGVRTERRSTSEGGITSPRTRGSEAGSRVTEPSPDRTPARSNPREDVTPGVRGRTPSGPSVDDTPSRRTPARREVAPSDAPRITDSPRGRSSGPADTPRRIEREPSDSSPRYTAPRGRSEGPSPRQYETPDRGSTRSYSRPAPEPRIETPRQREAPSPRIESPRVAPQRESAPRENSRPQMRDNNGPSERQRSAPSSDAPAVRGGGDGNSDRGHSRGRDR